jgi:hypothetical protein
MKGGGTVGKGTLAPWMDSLLEQGIWLSQFVKEVKEKFPGTRLSLPAHVRFRRSQGWKIDEQRKEDGDVFYKVQEVPVKQRRVEKEKKSVEVSAGIEKQEKRETQPSKKTLLGVGLYFWNTSEGMLTAKVGAEIKSVMFESGRVEKALEELFGAEVELKNTYVDDMEGREVRGVFLLWKRE